MRVTLLDVEGFTNTVPWLDVLGKPHLVVEGCDELEN